MDKQKEQELIDALNEYYISEGWNTIDKLPENGIIALGHTTNDLDDNDEYEHDIDVEFNLNSLSYLNYVDGKMILEEPINSIDGLISDLISCNADTIADKCIERGRQIYGDNHEE